MKRILKSTFVAAAVLGLAWSASATLISNGSFENGDGNNNPAPPALGQQISLGVNSTAIDGWTVVQGEITWLANGNVGLTASDGIRFLDLSGYHDGVPYGGVTLAIGNTINTVLGQTYRVSFDIGSDTRYNSVAPSVKVTIGGNDSIFTATVSQQSDWDSFYVDFAGTGGAVNLQIAGEPPNSGQIYIGLDNVAVNAVPDVGSTFALMLLGLGGLLPFCRKNR